MELRVYSPELTFLGVVDNYTALLWNRKYYEPGSFELHAPLTDENLELLQAGNIIARKDAVEAGIIEEIENQEGGSSSKITRAGRFLSAYLDRRILKYTINFTGTYDAAMQYLLKQVTEIPLLKSGNESGDTQTVSFQVTWKNLQSYLTKLAKCSGIGYRIRPDFREKVLYFDTYSGNDYSLQQSENPRVIFSPQFDNINNITYSYDESNEGTVFYIGGEGEGSSRTIVIYEAGETSGLSLKEVFIDAKDLTSDDLSAAEYKETLLQRGYEKAESYVINENIEADLSNQNFVYKEDWDLGDIVSVRKSEWDIVLNERITEIQETYENGGITITPTFGSALPETIDLSED